MIPPLENNRLALIPLGEYRYVALLHLNYNSARLSLAPVVRKFQKASVASKTLFQNLVANNFYSSEMLQTTFHPHDYIRTNNFKKLKHKVLYFTLLQSDKSLKEIWFHPQMMIRSCQGHDQGPCLF